MLYEVITEHEARVEIQHGRLPPGPAREPDVRIGAALGGGQPAVVLHRNEIVVIVPVADRSDKYVITSYSIHYTKLYDIMEKGVVRHHAAASELKVNDPVIQQYLGV